MILTSTAELLYRKFRYILYSLCGCGAGVGDWYPVGAGVGAMYGVEEHSGTWQQGLVGSLAKRQFDGRLTYLVHLDEIERICYFIDCDNFCEALVP